MLKSILKTATLRQSAITTTGTLVNGALGALFYILVARFLGPYDFGLLTVAITTLTLIGDIADFGTNTGMVRFVPAYIKSDEQRAFQFLKVSLEIKVVVGFVLLILGFVFSPFIAEIIFGKPDLVIPLRLVMVGTLGALLFSFATSALQATQKFFTWSVVNVVTNAIRIGLVGILIAFNQLSINTSLVSYIILPFFGFFISLLFLPTREFLKVGDEFKIVNKFLNYNIYVALFTIFAAFSARLDTFLSARLLSPSDVGIYGAANQLTAVFPQIVSALGVVVAPKFSSFNDLPKMMEYFKKLQILVIVLALGILVLMPVADFLIPIFFGKVYESAIPVFNILLIGELIFLISVPLHNSIFYFFSKPHVFVWVALGHLLIIGFLGYFMISRFGITGTAITVLVGMVFNLIAPLLWFLKRVYI